MEGIDRARCPAGLRFGRSLPPGMSASCSAQLRPFRRSASDRIGRLNELSPAATAGFVRC